MRFTSLIAILTALFASVTALVRPGKRPKDAHLTCYRFDLVINGILFNLPSRPEVPDNSTEPICPCRLGRPCPALCMVAK